MPISPTYLHKKGLSQIFFKRWDDGVTELALSPVLQWQSAGAGAWGLFAVGPPREQSCARRYAQREVRHSECPNGAPHTSPG
jgi:hypothetical protein